MNSRFLKITTLKLTLKRAEVSFFVLIRDEWRYIKEQIITVTEDAAKQVAIVRQNEPENSDKTLRIFVEEGGCSGLQYGMVFDEKRENDHVIEFFGETVLVDDFSANYLRGAVVDYHDDLNDSGFKIKNPNAKQSCGCGNSFET